MSNMNVDSLANRAGTGSPDIVGGELSRARFNLNGTGVIAPRDSFNVSSFTDLGTGKYRVTFATAFPASDYTRLINVWRFSAASFNDFGMTDNTALLAASTDVRCSGSGADADYNVVMGAFFGDKP